MDDLARDVRATRQHDLQAFSLFLLILYLELGLEIVHMLNNHVNNHVEKVSKLYE